jgi:hypothetical protein
LQGRKGLYNKRAPTGAHRTYTVEKGDREGMREEKERGGGKGKAERERERETEESF